MNEPVLRFLGSSERSPNDARRIERAVRDVGRAVEKAASDAHARPRSAPEDATSKDATSRRSDALKDARVKDVLLLQAIETAELLEEAKREQCRNEARYGTRNTFEEDDDIWLSQHVRIRELQKRLASLSSRIETDLNKHEAQLAEIEQQTNIRA